jgi:hypothetical protein
MPAPHEFPHPYYFPLGAAIAPLGYLVLFPDVGSNLLASGAKLSFSITGTSIDQLTIPTLGDDQSYARIPDGKNTWSITISPTVDAGNSSPIPATSSVSDTPHRILLTILIVALAFMLFLCWRLLRPS